MTQQTQKQKPMEKKAGMPAGSQQHEPADLWDKEGKEITGGAIHKWSADDVIKGRFMRIRPLGLGNVADLRDPDNELITVGCPTILESKLAVVPRGMAVRIVCDGMRPTEGGQQAWQFRVFELGMQDALPF